MLSIIKSIVLAALGITIWQCKNIEPSKMEDKEEQITHAPDKYRDLLTVEYIMGQFNPSDHKDFVLIDSAYSNQQGRYLHKEAYDAFIRMSLAASRENIELKIVSAARNFFYQKGIWERKWTGENLLSSGVNASTIKDKKERALQILLYSSMPGSSRHHWGTDIDINNFNNSYFDKGRGREEYEWLLIHGPEYGFNQPYTSKENGRTGYEEEKWHWSYFPISDLLTSHAHKNLTNDMIRGFMGSEVAGEIDVISNYVLGINPEMLQD